MNGLTWTALSIEVYELLGTNWNENLRNKVLSLNNGIEEYDCAVLFHGNKE